MRISPDTVARWCRDLLEPLTATLPSMEEMIEAIPRLDSLVDVPQGTPVIVRCDTNVAIAPGGSIASDVRIRSLLDTLRFGLNRGWRQVIHGHIGIASECSLRPVADRLGQILQSPVHFLTDWMDESTGEVAAWVGEQIHGLPPGALVMLENARFWPLETSLWRPKPRELASLLPRLTCYTESVRRELGKVHINEGFAASNCDLSSALVPMAMDRVALGRHVASELEGPVLAARSAEIVVFSGAKFNKLDDLEGVISQGRVKLVIAGGLLALPLLFHWQPPVPFEMGRADEVPASAMSAAKRVVQAIRDRGIELVLPVDFVLEDGQVVERIPPGSAHRDVGPKTVQRFQERLMRYAVERPGAVLFHNGVLGKFECPPFDRATSAWISALQQANAAGLRVYIGGGEGGLAMSQFGDISKVTHCFTAGTTILKALGEKPIPYVWALWKAAQQETGNTPAGTEGVL
jgi:phosphoglycerate kinase